MRKNKLPEDIQELVYSKFITSPLKQKIVIYAKLLHGNAFKPINNDFLGLNRRLVSKIFKNFTDSVKEEVNERSKKSKK
jgi:hypothetical protein